MQSSSLLPPSRVKPRAVRVRARNDERKDETHSGAKANTQHQHHQQKQQHIQLADKEKRGSRLDKVLGVGVYLAASTTGNLSLSLSLSLSLALFLFFFLSLVLLNLFFFASSSLSLSLSLSSLHPYESIAVALQYAPLAPTRSETAQAAITSGSDRKDADNIASDFPAFLKEGGEWSSKRYQDVVDYYTRFVPLSKTRFSSPNSFLSSSL